MIFTVFCEQKKKLILQENKWIEILEKKIE